MESRKQGEGTAAGNPFLPQGERGGKPAVTREMIAHSGEVSKSGVSKVKRVVTRFEQVRSWGLLNMEYTPAELGAEIGCDAQRVRRVLIEAGCPHRQDEDGRFWIHGSSFKDWANRALNRDVDKLPEGQAYCLRCRAVVAMAGEIEIKPISRSVERLVGNCPTCGAVVNRMRARRAV